MIVALTDGTKASFNLPPGPQGHTLAVRVGAPDPTGGADGDWYLQTTAAGQVLVWRKVGGAWQNTNTDVRGPMGPALSIKSNMVVSSTAAAPACGAANAGDAVILAHANLNPGDTIPQADLPAWLAALPSPHGTVTAPATGTLPTGVVAGQPDHQVGDIVFCDGTTLHNGGEVQGPQGTQGPPATVAAQVLTAGTLTPPAGVTWPTQPGGGAAAIGDLIVTVNGVPSNLGNVVGPPVDVHVKVGDGAIGLLNHVYYQQVTKGAAAPTWDTANLVNWTDAGAVTITAPRTFFGKSGNGPPGAAVVKGPGDFYLDTATSQIYKVVAGAWEATPSITMKTGDTFLDLIQLDSYVEA
jgi:hypothetical protein